MADTHTYIHPYPPFISRAQTHTSWGAPFVSTSRIASITSQTRDLVADDRHT